MPENRGRGAPIAMCTKHCPARTKRDALGHVHRPVRRGVRRRPRPVHVFAAVALVLARSQQVPAAANLERRAGNTDGMRAAFAAAVDALRGEPLAALVEWAKCDEEPLLEDRSEVEEIALAGLAVRRTEAEPETERRSGGADAEPIRAGTPTGRRAWAYPWRRARARGARPPLSGKAHQAAKPTAHHRPHSRRPAAIPSVAIPRLPGRRTRLPPARKIASQDG